MNEQLYNKLLAKYSNNNDKIKADLTTLGYDINHLSKECVDFYSKNPGYFFNLKKEKDAYLISPPQIKFLAAHDPACPSNIIVKNEKLRLMRIIYAIIGVESSFDNSPIDKNRFESVVWLKHFNIIANTFSFNNMEMNDTVKFKDVFNLVDNCIYNWSGGKLQIREDNKTYFIVNNGYNIIN
jgi:hypothetical protein